MNIEDKVKSATAVVALVTAVAALVYQFRLAPGTSARTSVASTDASAPARSVSVHGDNNESMSIGNLNGGVGAVFGNNNQITVGPQPSPGSGVDDRLFGMWYEDYSYGVTGGNRRIRGLMQIHRNGRYDFAGNAFDDVKAGGKRWEVDWVLENSGEWTMHGKYISMKSDATKSIPRAIRVDGTDLSVSHLESLGFKPRIEDDMLHGRSSDFEIMSLTDSRFRARGTDTTGNAFELEGVKRAGSS